LQESALARKIPGSSAAADERAAYLDDPSRDARPTHYDPNGEQLDMVSQHEPGVIGGEGQCCGYHPDEDPENEKNRS
jgi:hypothetical protein